ncbi:IS66 family transposase, partial [Ferrimonas pelagia]|uniref:IS66 family transposase n=1 Tax=Ferrimonas pelagia TaxID=1177826 RepID=UPI0031EEB13E
MKTNKRYAPPPEFKNDEEARDIIRFLWDKLIELEDRINQNSQNSSLPPSVNRPGQGKPTKRKPSGKKPGAQPGHKGHRRPAHPHDERLQVEQYHPNPQCSCCGAKVVSNARPTKTRQVFELPKVLYEVTEHQAYSGQCTRCGHQNKAQLPSTVSQSQMGPNLLAFIVLQSGQFHQSVRQIRQHLLQTFGLNFSTGAISEAQGRVTHMLTPTHEAIRAAVDNAAIIHADETSHQRKGERRWMWLSCSDQAAYFLTHYSRGQEAGKKLLGETPRSFLITDQYAGYNFT